MELVQSNDVDALAGLVATRLTRIKDPLEPLYVIVPDPLVGRHLRLLVACQLGICAQLRVVTMAELSAELAALALGPPVIAHTPASARWAVVAQLIDDGAAPTARLWSRADMVVNALREAQRLRPELLRAFSAGAEPGDELARCWRALYAAGADSPPARQQALIEAIERGFTEPISLVVVTGLGLTVSDWHLLAAIDRQRSVLVLLWHPSASFYADGRTERTLARLAQEPDPLLDHPQLSANGRLPAQTLALLYGSGWPLVENDQDHYRRPLEHTLLARIQRDLVDLQRPQRAAAELVEPDPDDHSLSLIVAPTELREVEAVHELLRKRFETDPTLRPEDVLLVLADFDRYAPLVRAVFKATMPGDRDHLPLDLNLSGVEDERRQACLILIELGTGTPSAATLQRLLELQPVQGALGLDATQVERALAALTAAGFSYGIEHSCGGFAWALDRLLLGYALGDDGVLFNQVAAVPTLEGQDARWLDALLVVLEALRHWRQACSESATAADWRRAWTALSSVLLVEAAGSAEDQAIFAVLDGLALTDPPRLVPFALLAAAWQSALPAPCFAPRLHRGGINVVAFRPWQLVPARVVAVLGLNDGVTPRSQPLALAAAWFDLTPAQPLDARARDHDRTLFLFALQAAREAALFSCVGSGDRGDERPPSVLYEELLALACAYFSGDREMVRARLQIRPPLHAFSLAAYPPASSVDERLRSIHEHWRPVTERALADRSAAPLIAPVFSIAELPDVAGEVAFSDLLALARDPLSAYLHRALGVARSADDHDLPADARLTLSNPERSTLLTALAAELAHGRLPAMPSPALIARGLLPLGPAQLRCYHHARVEVRRITDLRVAGSEHVHEVGRIELAPGLYLHVGQLRLQHGAWEQIHYRVLTARDQIGVLLGQWLLDLQWPGLKARALGLAKSNAHDQARPAALIEGRCGSAEHARRQLAIWARCALLLKERPLWLIPDLIGELLARAQADPACASPPSTAWRQSLLDDLKDRPATHGEAAILGHPQWPLHISAQVLDAMTLTCQRLIPRAGLPKLERP